MVEDIEALQAQIDLSNSIAFDIVSSWMKPATSNNTAETVSHVIARELEEHAKRPPRLGLGAAVSKSSVATSREAARLKGKLMGTKRPRDEGGNGPSTLETGDDQAGEDVEEDESRSAAISRPNTLLSAVGFSNRTKKNPKKHENNAQEGTMSISEFTSSKPNPFVLPDTPRSPSLVGQSTPDLASPSPARPNASAEKLTTSKKKKHKKKKLKATEDDMVSVEDDEWTGFSNHTLADPTPAPVEESPTAVQETGHLPSSPRRTPKILKSILSTPSSIVDLTSPIQPTPSPCRRTDVKNSSCQISPRPPPFVHPQLADQPVPLLNLHGPPPRDAQQEDHDRMVHKESESPKRKRPKRKRRKRSKNSGVGEL